MCGVHHQLLCKIVNENSGKNKPQFKNISFSIDVTDKIFQLANCSSGTLLEGKLHFSRKYKLYGYKTEVPVAPTGQAIDVTAHKPQSVSDFVA